MTRKQIIVCTILAFLCSPLFPDPLTDLMYRIPTTIVTLIALSLIGRKSLIQDAQCGIQRLVAGLTTATIVLLVHVVQLNMILVAMRK
jgi:hypothetical protein